MLSESHRRLLGETPAYDASWPGYTLSELRYRRALVEVKLEIEKEQLLADARELTSGATFIPAKGNFGKIARKIVTNLDYVDYGFLIFKAASAFLSISRRFKKKK